MKYLYPIIMLGLTVLTTAAVELPQELSLDRAIELAREHNPVLNNARLAVDFQEGRILEAASTRYPALNMTGNYSVYGDDRLQSFGVGAEPDQTHWQAAAEASLHIWSGGRATRRVEAQRLEQVARTYGVEAAEQQLMASVCTLFYHACLAEQEIRIQQASLELRKEQVRLAENRKKAGVGTAFDVLQAEVAVANAQPALIRAQNARKRRIEDLRTTIGVSYPADSAAEDIELLEVKELPEVEQPLSDLLAGIEQRRPELRAISERLAGQQQQLEVKVRERFPLVTLFANYGMESDQFGDEDLLYGWVAGVRMSWSILDGGAIRGQVVQAENSLAQLANDQVELLLQVDNEIRQAIYNLREAREIMTASQEVKQQALEAFRLARNRFEAGKGTQLDVLTAELQLKEADLSYHRARTDAAVAVLELQRAAGHDLLPVLAAAYRTE